MRVGHRRRKQTGFSFVELAIALVIFGVTGSTMLYLAAAHKQDEKSFQAKSSVKRTAAVIETFAAVNGQLPCPAKNDGKQLCDGNLTGKVPWVTLGLGDAEGKLDYSLSTASTDLLAPPDFKVLVPLHLAPQAPTTVGSVTLKSILGTVTQDDALNLCGALQDQSHSTKVAFMVSEPASAILTSGWNVASEKVSRARLSAQLQCHLLIPTSGRAGFNAALAAGTMLRTQMDVQEQVNVALGGYYWDFAQGGFFLTTSIHTSLNTLPKLALGYATFKSSYYVNVSPMVKAIVAIATSAANTGRAAVNLERFSLNLETAILNREEMNRIVAEIARLYQQSSRNAVLGASSRFFLVEQGAVPLADLPQISPFIGAYANGGDMTQLSKHYAQALGYPAPDVVGLPSRASDFAENLDLQKISKDYNQFKKGGVLPIPRVSSAKP